MTRRRRLYFRSRMAVGPFRLVTFRHQRGYAVLDERTGAVAYTTPHPISGRPIPALEPDARRALTIAAMLDADDRPVRCSHWRTCHHRPCIASRA